MADNLVKLVNDDEVHIPSVLSATFPCGDSGARIRKSIVAAAVEMLWGMVTENLTVHVSGLRDHPRGHFQGLLQALHARLGDCPDWWRPTFSLIGTDDNNGVQSVIDIVGCENLRQNSDGAIPLRCVSFSGFSHN